MTIGTATREPAPSLPRPKASARTTKIVRTKLATCNARNLALPDIPYYPGEKYSWYEYEQKIRWLGGQLSSLDADLVAFQEVFHSRALEDAVANSELAGAPVVVENLDPESCLRPRVGLVTRLPILGAPTFIRDIPKDALLAFQPGASDSASPVPVTSFLRPVLRAEIGLWNGLDGGGDRAIVYVVHLKSMTPEPLAGENLDDPMVYARAQARAQIRRTVEAAGIRSLVRQDIEGTTTPVIVLGDCNAGNPSVVAQIMSGPSPSRYDSSARQHKLWDRMLYDAIDLQSQMSLNATYYTHIFDGKYEQLDHILLSEEFYSRNPRHIAWVEYVRLFTDHLVDSTLCADSVPRWVSDHGWVVVTLRREERSVAAVQPAIDSVPVPE